MPGRKGEPLLNARLDVRLGGKRLPFLAPRSVFSANRIDRGTLLLLERLPPGEPRSFLDLGCGYGALGLPVAARFPRARALLVDRDLLAVEFARRNAAIQGAGSVEVRPSLGYRDLGTGGRFDWILSNFPARAGERVMEAFIEGGRARLAAGGEMRIVVIAPLGPAVERLAASRGFEHRSIDRSRQHAIFSFPSAEPDEEPREPPDPGDEVYERDCIRLSLPERLELVRPSDLADEPHRLTAAVPLLASRLPEKPPPRILVFRSGYGLLPALALARYPGARVAAIDRDLLATAFTRRNTSRSGERIHVLEGLGLAAAKPLGPFDLILGELSPPLGPPATLEELGEVRAALAPGGEALVLGLGKQWKEFLRGESKRLGLSVLGTSGPAALYLMKDQVIQNPRHEA